MATYRFLTQDLLTGAWLDAQLPLSDVSIMWELNGPGSLSASITPRYMRVNTASVAPARTAIYVERDGVLLWGGVIWSCSPEKESYKLEAAGFSSYLGRRHDLHGNLNARGPWVYADPTDVMRAAWAYAQEQSDGNLGVIVDATTSAAKVGTPAEPLETKWWEAPNLGDFVKDLVSADDGFDYTDVVAWSTPPGPVPTVLMPPTNAALGKTVVQNGGPGAQTGSEYIVTNGSGTDSLTLDTGTGLDYVQVDLGDLTTIEKVQVWRTYVDGRTYHETKTEISADGVTWQTVFDSSIHGANLLANPGYETALVNVAPFGSVTPTRVTTGQRSGAGAVSVTTTTTGNQGMIHYAPIGTSIAAGTKVKCSAWVKGDPGRTLTVAGRAISTDQVNLYLTGMGQVSVTATGAWQYLETAEWTYTGGPFSFGFSAISAGASGATLLVDDASATARTEYPETAAGRTTTFAARAVRYIRDWSNGSSAATSNQWKEVQAFTPVTYAPDYSSQEPGAPVRRIKLGYPRLGRRRTDISFKSGVNISQPPRIDYVGDDYAQVVIGLGAGEGSARIRTTDAIRNGYPRLEHVEEQPDIKGVDQLTKLIRAERLARVQLGEISGLTVLDHKSAPVGSYAVGDDVQVWVHDDWTDLDLWCRIVRYTLTPSSDQGETVQLELARADSFHYGAPA